MRSISAHFIHDSAFESVSIQLTHVGQKFYFWLFPLSTHLVTAVYGNSTGMGDVFDYTSYIYLLAIVSLAIINPIGFVLMEYHKQSRDSDKKFSCYQVRLL